MSDYLLIVWMARTKTISDEQILDAARRMFEEHGFAATTSQIADAAGVSEGSIFRRWNSKDELMIAALGIRRPEWLDTVGALGESDRELEEQLTVLADQILDFFLEHLPKMTAMLSCGIQMKRKFLRSNDALPVQGVKAVTNFFAEHRRAGRIRMTDPEVIARMFVASIHHYAFAEFAGLNEMMPIPRETYIRGIVANLMQGIEPAAEE